MDSEVWLLKTNNDDDIIYEKSDTLLFGFPGNEKHFIAGVELSNSGSIYIAGNVRTYKNDGFIIKYNNDGCWNTICTTTSIGTFLNKEYAFLYPNPVSSEINVTMPDNSPDSILNIYDITGKHVMMYKCSAGVNTISIKLKSGYYLYRIDQKNIPVHFGKFIKA